METLNFKMKLMALFVLFLMVLIKQESIAQAPVPTWHQVGEKINIGGDPLGYPENSIAISPLNIPYIAYKNRLSGLNLISGWQAAPISNMRVYATRPIWSPMVQPDLQEQTRMYVGFLTSQQSNIAQDPGVSLYIRQYNPATGLFTTIGNERVGRTSSPEYKPYSFVTAPDGTVYVAFLEFVNHGLYRTTVKKFDGINWVTLGAPQFSPNGETLDIRLLADGTPIFGYWSYGNQDESPSYKLFRYNEATDSWDIFPMPSITGRARMDVGPEGTLFIASISNNLNRDAIFIVHKWNDADGLWEDLGGFPRSAYGNLLIRSQTLMVKSDNEGNPVVMYLVDNNVDTGFSKVVKYNPDTNQWDYMLRCNDAGVCTSRINDAFHSVGPGKIHDIDFDTFNNPWVIVHTGNNGESEYTQQILRWGCDSLEFVAPIQHSPLDGSGPYAFNSMPLVWNPTPANCFNQTPETYHIEVATDAGFVNITHSASPLNIGDFEIVHGKWIFRANNLNPSTTYFWRVRPHLSANWSEVWTFTTDAVIAGANWAAVNSPLPGINLKSVLALSANYFYVGTDDGRVFYTTNGGATYNEATLSPVINTPINDITMFSDNRMAIATGSGVQIANRDIDGTYTQFEQSGNALSATHKVYFNWAANTGFAVQKDSRIGKFALNNDAWNWTTHNLGLLVEPHAIGFRRSPEQSMGFVVGDALDLGFLPRTGLFRTRDLGFSYMAFGQQNNQPTITGLGDFPVNFYDIAMTMEPGLERWIAIGSKESIYAATPNPLDFHAGDIVGQNWVRLNHAGRNEGLSFRALELYHAGGADNQHTGFIVGDEGKIIRIRFDEATQTWNTSQMGWDVFHTLWDVHITGNYDGNWQPNGPQFAFAVGDNGTIRRFQIEEPQGIELECVADLVLDTPFPSFNWNITGGAPIDYTVEISQDGNLIVMADTPNRFFSLFPTRLKHQHEYTLSITANYAGHSGAPVSCNFTINDPVIYVNKALGVGNGDGSSWISAYREVTSALDVLVDGQQVWVAAGTYTPQPNAVMGAVDRTLSFVIDGLQDVALLGGFAGFEANADQRNPDVNVTILSGDLLGDDNAADNNTRMDNSYNVLVIENTDNSVLIDGFTIRSGNGVDNFINGSYVGAGVSLMASDAILSNSRIIDNFGSALYATGHHATWTKSSPTIDNVEIEQNITFSLGSLMAFLSEVSINRTVFYRNSTPSEIFLAEQTNLMLTNSIIVSNGSVHGIINTTQLGPDDELFLINSTILGNNQDIAIQNQLGKIRILNSIIEDIVSPLSSHNEVVHIGNSIINSPIGPNVTNLGGNLVYNGIQQLNIFQNKNDVPNGLYLDGCSPALNSGNAAFYPESLPLFDFFSLPRIQGGGRIDMGAIETQTDPGGCGLWDVLVDVEEIQPGRNSTNGSSRSLVFGMAENATDGYDSGLDQLAPPMPPFGVFDARLVSGEPPVHYFKDFRPDSENQTEWTLFLTPSTSATGLKISWSPSAVSQLGGTLELRYGTMFISSVNMSQESSVTLPADVGSVTIRYTPNVVAEVVLNYPIGWNLVSVPATPEDNTASNFFPSMEPGTFFGFNNGYTDETEFTAGSGYWVLLTQPQETILTEDLVDVLTISLNEGWNLTGSIAREVFTSEIHDPGFILSMSSIYEYNPTSGYVNPSSIMPGKGYWIRALSAGHITLGSSSNGISNGGMLASTPELDMFHTLGIQHGEASVRSFYFGADLTEEHPAQQSFELPPLPPVGAFDIRFQNHSWLTEARETTLLVQSPQESITLTFHASENEPDQDVTITIHRTGGVVEDYQLWSNEFVTVDGTGITKIEVSVNTTVNIPGIGTELPQMVELAQNYPNPFNPTTNITFGLPESGTVRLDVFNVMGQRVATLVNDQKPAGYHTVTFDASRLASGTYVYRLQTGNTVITKKLMLVK